MNRPTYGYSADGSDDDSAERESVQPTCPRHPDRVSYVRCQRCDRPACPECQRPAAVGMRCVDCDRELTRSQAAARPRNAMGARIGAATPIVTYVLLGLCGLAFLGQTVSGGLVEGLAIFSPYRVLAMPWIFVSAGFLHAGIMHLLLNGYALWMVGQYLERSMGHWRFLALFLISVIGGHTAVLLFANPAADSWVTYTLGASGGVFGMFGAMFVVGRRMGAQTGQIVVLIVLNLVITFTVPGISWEGHLGGLVLGTATIAALFAIRPKATPGADLAALSRRSAILHSAVIGCALLLCLTLIAVKVVLAGPDMFASW